jgi:hypothetical protein
LLRCTPVDCRALGAAAIRRCLPMARPAERLTPGRRVGTACRPAVQLPSPVFEERASASRAASHARVVAECTRSARHSSPRRRAVLGPLRISLLTCLSHLPSHSTCVCTHSRRFIAVLALTTSVGCLTRARSMVYTWTVCAPRAFFRRWGDAAWIETRDLRTAPRGHGGIRTHEGVPRPYADYKSGALSHSAMCPCLFGCQGTFGANPCCRTGSLTTLWPIAVIWWARCARHCVWLP